VLKKLRIAFELTDADMHEVFAGAGFAVSKPELSALFRQPGHRNYRACGDQMLRHFLKGLTMRLRDVQGAAAAPSAGNVWARSPATGGSDRAAPQTSAAVRKRPAPRQ
jgi:hypothetical protein